MAVNLQLVPATAGKRLGAAVTDWLFPLVVPAVLFSIGFAGVTRTRSGGFITYDTASVVLFGGIGTGLALVYLFVLLGLEARTGKTPGNLLLGIRSADNDGYAPGAGAVFLRSIITGAGAVLVLIAAVLVVVFKWFDAALLILGPLQLLAAVWAVLVVVSNTVGQERRGLRGWHDNAAKTLVFRRQGGPEPHHQRRHPGPVQLRAAGPAARPAGAVTRRRCPRAARSSPPRRRLQPGPPQPRGPAGASPHARHRSQSSPTADHPRTDRVLHLARVLCTAGQSAPARSYTAAAGRPGSRHGTEPPDSGLQGSRTRTTTSNAPRSGPAPPAAGAAAPAPRLSCGSGSTTAGTSSWTGTSWWDATPWVRPANSMPSSWPWTIPAAPSPKPTCTS